MSEPKPDMVIVGYARLFEEFLDRHTVGELRNKVGVPPDGQWGAIFIVEDGPEGSRRKWTLMTVDHHYAEMLASEVGRVEVPTAVLRERFPAYQRGWVLAESLE